MWLVVVILFTAVIIWYEAPALLKHGQFRELAFFGILMLIAFALTAAQSLKVKMSNPLDAIVALYSPLSRIISAFTGS
ncbi:hypothetical protein [Paenibacillus pinihumi]|uniref:hypothetical protein n=1 Tax=Paenibacillus pinihumi TaxID=669462 RepID=UPI00040C2EA1|nr:hypothetical protein [Paenibacillus pinihumi]